MSVNSTPVITLRAVYVTTLLGATTVLVNQVTTALMLHLNA